MLLVVFSTYCFFDVLVAAAVVGSTCPKRGDGSVKGGANTDNTVLEQTIWRLKTDSRKRFILFMYVSCGASRLKHKQQHWPRHLYIKDI